MYQEVKEELRDMGQYLDSNVQRQQSTTIVRLTVVTTFSMIGTVTTGLLGMNLIAEADAPTSTRLTYFFVTTLVTALLMLLAILKSKQLSNMMDVLADDQKSLRTRLAALGKPWQRNPSKPK
jgi:Mg2+ and Co2+ transporter CorA